ncbi:hypothetical protein [Mycobacterium avium]|uniref:hypothetical protein n=1 Tax=Mycobacterium avium TaxID=1764 RepID=UPI000B1EAF33|nr:hypothetical protein [Mycobacterium avium]WOF20610.1 hypothetical protein IHV82_08740 [Mycobacterium avium]
MVTPEGRAAAGGDGLSGATAARGILADVKIGVRAYWRFIVAPGGARDTASG